MPLKPLTKTSIVKLAKKLFGGKPYALSYSSGQKYLVLAHPRTSHGQWFKNGEPQTFKYYERKCIASGDTWDEVWQSALWYDCLSKMTIEELLLHSDKIKKHAKQMAARRKAGA